VRVTEVRTGRRLLTQIETEVARVAAEARAEAEAQARRQLEIRLQELEALLRSKS
jgi:hypothetical protein